MHSILRRIRHHNADSVVDSTVTDHPRFSHATWGAIAVGVIGAGASLYGANKQSKSQAATNASNQASVDKSDQNAWINYLLTRGVAVDPNTPTGTIPTSGRAVNTRLPLWANMTVPGRPAAQRGGFLKPRT
jgi:hypothetical protein